jgi:hypothetical protein
MTEGQRVDARALYGEDYMLLLMRRRLIRRSVTGTRRKTDPPVIRYDSKGNRVKV